MTRNIARAGFNWLRCTGISSAIPGTQLEVGFHDLDHRELVQEAAARLLKRYSSVLAIETRKGAHLITFDALTHATVCSSQQDLQPEGQDPRHTEAHERHGRSILRVTPKYDDGMDLRLIGLSRNRANTRAWSGPHWDFYRSLLGPIPMPGPLDQRLEGNGALTLEVYYTPAPQPLVTA